MPYFKKRFKYLDIRSLGISLEIKNLIYHEHFFSKS
jgi:hypothetical protein